MAIVKLEHVYKMMRQNDCPFWRIADSVGMKSVVAENDEEQILENAIELLQTDLENIDDNNVYITISSHTKAQKGKGGRSYKQFDFKVNLHKSESAGMAGAGAGGLLPMLLQQMKENSELMRKLELKNQEVENDKKIAALETQISGAGSTGWEMALPYLDKFLSNGKPVALAGGEDKDVEDKIFEKQQTIRKALARLAKVDKNLPDTLTALANYAEKNPDKYRSFIPFLK